MKDNIELLNLIVAAINLVVFIVFTFLVFFYNKAKDRIDFLRQVPLISIEQNDHNNYSIKNVGSGPALNVRILSEPDFDNRFWNKNEIGYALFGDNTELEIDPNDKSAYLILYNDIHQKNYFSYMIDNTLKFGSVEDAKSDKDMMKILKFNKSKEQFRTVHIPSI